MLPSGQDADSPLQIIWITPLRALAADTLRAPIEALNLPLSVEARTGDTTSYRKAKIRENFPYCLVATPESLSLLFTNTRAQTEIWFQEISKGKPEWADQIALHHGSLDKKERAEVEGKLKSGSVRCVVCTSSFDLGIDFSPVDQVIQIGSPKGIFRLIQRAGRSGHQPGEISRITCVPTNALELIEFAAVREAWENRHQEAKPLLEKPLDVLVQHLVTLVTGNPATPDELKKEIKNTFTYRDLSEAEWQWALAFITNGGALAAHTGLDLDEATFRAAVSENTCKPTCNNA